MKVKKVYAVEVSGLCNLANFCTWCAMHTSNKHRSRGLMSDEVVDLTLNWVEKLGRVDALALHNFGEPLLHRSFDVIAARFAKITPITMSTNGEFLDEVWADRLAKVPWEWISVSPWKPEAAARATKLLEERGIRVAHPPGIVHDWAGQAKTGPHGVRLHNYCPFLLDGMVAIRWNGDVASCCISDRDEDMIGTVYNRPEEVEMREYSICGACHLSKGK